MLSRITGILPPLVLAGILYMTLRLSGYLIDTRFRYPVVLAVACIVAWLVAILLATVGIDLAGQAGKTSFGQLVGEGWLPGATGMLLTGAGIWYCLKQPLDLPVAVYGVARVVVRRHSRAGKTGRVLTGYVVVSVNGGD